LTEEDKFSNPKAPKPLSAGSGYLIPEEYSLTCKYCGTKTNLFFEPLRQICPVCYEDYPEAALDEISRRRREFVKLAKLASDAGVKCKMTEEDTKLADEILRLSVIAKGVSHSYVEFEYNFPSQIRNSDRPGGWLPIIERRTGKERVDQEFLILSALLSEMLCKRSS
jgi:hypothetical protein